MVTAVSAVVPAQVTFPALLLCEPNQTTTPLNQTCLRSCDTRGFTGEWTQPLAFTICDMSAAWCEYLLFQAPNGSSWLTQAQDKLAPGFPSSLILAYTTIQDPQATEAARLCTWVTWVTTLPVLCLIIAALIAAALLITALLEIAQATAGVVVSAVVYSRTPEKL